MSHSPRTSLKFAFASILGMAMVATPIVALPALAVSTGVVINEAYLNGGSANAVFTSKFVELYNPTAAEIPLGGMSLQYRKATGDANPSSTVPLVGTIPAGGYFLVQGGSNGGAGVALPTPDQVATGLNAGGGGGTLFLANQTETLESPGTGSPLDQPEIVDLLGYGNSNTFETQAAGTASVTTSLNRTDGIDTDNNKNDFTTKAAVTPTNSAGETIELPEPTPPPGEAGTLTIAEIQGTEAVSPHEGDHATTHGVVTAAYPTGGFNGFYIQTPGTGGVLDLDEVHFASDGLFVYSPAKADLTIGDYVEVTGLISEYFEMTQITPDNANAVTVLTEEVDPVLPAVVGLPTAEEQRESLEGMLIAPQGAFTVTDTYSTNQYADVRLAAGDTPLMQPTVVELPSVDNYTAAIAANNARSVILDDGASINFLPRGGGANMDIPVPYVSNENPVRVGEAVTFTHPVIFDYRNDAWKYQPTTQLTVENAANVQPVEFDNTRTNAPEDVGGDLKLATFNVLNYFTTTGVDYMAAGGGTCTSYNDRADNPITVNRCDGFGPRGAWDDANLQRQQDKIVSALNALDADVVGLEEIEATTAVGGTDRDAALNSLVTALNVKAGSDVWSAVPSPLPANIPDSEDVIRTAFIYKNAVAELVGDSTILMHSDAFANAREPLAQAFKLKGDADADAFVAIVNHFKSKGSGSGTGNTDIGDGQGASNADRVAQANALVTFAEEVATAADTEKVFLLGDFNAYLMEDPIQVLVAAGYVDQGSKTDKQTYSYGGMIGSLDHIFASPDAEATVADADIWNVNAYESVALEYSRYNYNATNFYRSDMFRASDHDPVIVGLNLAEPSTTVDLNLLNINDFHGRIDGNTVKFAGTIEELRAQYGDANSLLGSAGDNIGASLFASSSQQDVPTIDVLNALGLQSSVGNHEFDTGYPDLTGRIAELTDWTYLGANVYHKGTTDPALPEYVVVEVGGVQVGVIGAVTEETPSLVTQSGISMLDFGDPVEAVNRVAAQLTDGDPSNGEADVIIAEYHEGAGMGESEGGTLENQLAAGGAFAEIVNNTSSTVDAIFTGHTHKAYAWEAPVPGSPDRTRPVLQTGSYGANIGQVVLTYDTAANDVVSYTVRNVPRTETSDADLVAQYPRVAQVSDIVDAAIKEAAIIGDQPIGSVTDDISRAFAGDVEDRGAESTIGNLVADSLVASLSDPTVGGAEIGVANPGGLRTDLLYDGDGVITYAEANAVLPFLNNLWTTTLTGAQFKQVLEQQWQRDKDGVEFTSGRTFLNLGLSDNVSYTYDPDRAMDDRVTSIMVDGAPIDPAKDYRIGSFSFLLQGGDNFWEFNNGADTRDSGLVDRDAWIAYITQNSPLSPAFDRRGVKVQGWPTAAVAPGDQITLTVSKLDLTSLGSPANTELALDWAGSTADLGTVPVVDGEAVVTFTVPADATEPGMLVLTASPTDTTVSLPFEVGAVTEPQPINSSPPTITGQAIVGKRLTAHPGKWDPAGLEFSYQWMRDGKSIADATGAKYRLVAADVGSKMTVKVSATKSGYGTADETSAPTAQVTWSPRITRIQGDDRYLTAINISRAGFRNAPIVFVVTGSGYADALSTAPVATMNGGPLLLTAKNSLPTVVADEITRLKPSKIVVVGGTGAVSNAVMNQLKKIASTDRIFGSDRYDTSSKINTHSKYGFKTAATAYVATGQTFPDGLSVSAAGAAIGAPVILVNGSAKTLDAGTKAELAKLKVKETIIAGGTGAVSAGIASALKAATGTTPDRRAGSDRYETSRLIGADIFAPAKKVYLATGTQFPDAMTGAVLAGKFKAPLYLVQPTCIPKATLTAITKAAPAQVTLFGGTGALSNDVANLKACK